MNNAQSGTCSTPAPGAFARRTGIAPGLIFLSFNVTTSPAEELHLWLRMGEVGRMAIVPQVTLRYREHQGSVSSTLHRQQVEMIRRVCERAWQRRGISDGKFVNKGWRPQNNGQRREVQIRKGWWVFNRGDRKLALEYALRAMCNRPSRGTGWRLLACSALRRTPVAPSTNKHRGTADV